MDAAPKKKLCLICQPHGLGDILFIQKIIWQYVSLGYHVMVPILEKLAWIRAYFPPNENVEYPLIIVKEGTWYGGFRFAGEFLALHEQSSAPPGSNKFIFSTPILYDKGNPETGFLFLALGSSYKWLDDRRMSSKYKYALIDHVDWADHVFLKRRTHVEKELFYDVLGLNDDSRYTLVNDINGNKTFPLDVPGKVVRMQDLDAFTLLDWLFVIEKATQIVTIDTSFVLLVEILKKQKPLYIVARSNPPEYETIKDSLSLDWKFVPSPADLKVSPV